MALQTLLMVFEVGPTELIVFLVLLVLALVVPLLVIGLVAFWIWMLVDCLTNEPAQGNDKVVWALVILLLQTLGALLYFLIRRPQRIREVGQ